MKTSLSQPLYIHELGKRSNQEDSFFIPDEANAPAAQFFMVCDGMGGHDKGEVASALVCKTMAEQVTAQLREGKPFDDGVLNEALQRTYAELDQLPAEGKRPGTTFTFLCFHPSGVTTANIGDSRIYHLRPREKKILFQSRDHSLVFDLYLMGELTFDEMATSPQKNVITKALMPGNQNHHRADIVHIADVKPGDCFLLCSDGLLEQTTNDQLIDLFAQAKDLDEVRQRLIEASADNADNHTAVILQVEGVEKTPGETLPDEEKSSPFNALNVRPIERSVDPTPQVAAKTTATASSAPASASKSSASSASASKNSSAKPSAPRRPAKSKKSISPMLTIALAVLLVILIAVIGVLLLRKSPSPSTPQPARAAAVVPADSAATSAASTSPAPVEAIAPAEASASAPASAPGNESAASVSAGNSAASSASAQKPAVKPSDSASPAPAASPRPKMGNMEDRTKTKN